MYLRYKNYGFSIATKTGGTTIRDWFAKYLQKTSSLEVRRNESAVTFLQRASNNIDDFLFLQGRYEKVGKAIISDIKNNEVVVAAMTRDPVERFLSAFRDKVLRAKLLNLSIDEAIFRHTEFLGALIEEPKKGITNLSRFGSHVAPLGWFHGPSKSAYQFVFRTEDIDSTLKPFLETFVLKTALPDLKKRDSARFPVSVSAKQRSQVAELFHKDYVAGWH